MNTPSTSTNLLLRGRLWIEAPEGTFLGLGRVRLLEHIQQLGSISAAAKAMKMSYRQAWGLVNVMNQHSSEPLVESSTGGKGGGGATLTGTGEAAIRLYRSALSDFEHYLERQSRSLTLENHP